MSLLQIHIKSYIQPPSSTGAFFRICNFSKHLCPDYSYCHLSFYIHFGEFFYAPLFPLLVKHFISNLTIHKRICCCKLLHTAHLSDILASTNCSSLKNSAISGPSSSHLTNGFRILSKTCISDFPNRISSRLFASSYCLLKTYSSTYSSTESPFLLAALLLYPPRRRVAECLDIY